jgi:hypothetical protein
MQAFQLNGMIVACMSTRRAAVFLLQECAVRPGEVNFVLK